MIWGIIISVIMVALAWFAGRGSGAASAKAEAKIEDFKRAEEIHEKAASARRADASPVDARLRSLGALRD